MISRKRGHSNVPLYFIGAPAAVAVWAGWVGLGQLCGFGPIHPFPGVSVFGLAKFVLNTAITLPIGMEAYGMYALGSWLDKTLPEDARKFAKWSAIGSLGLGLFGQVAYHLLNAAHAVKAPWWVVVLVSCLPVIALGFGSALAHLRRQGNEEDDHPKVVEIDDGRGLISRLLDDINDDDTETDTEQPIDVTTSAVVPPAGIPTQKREWTRRDHSVLRHTSASPEDGKRSRKVLNSTG